MIRSKEQCEKLLNDFCRSSYRYHLTPNFLILKKKKNAES